MSDKLLSVDTLKTNIRAFMELGGISEVALASKVNLSMDAIGLKSNVNTNTVKDWLRQDAEGHTPSTKFLPAIAKSLDKSIDDLFRP